MAARSVEEMIALVRRHEDDGVPWAWLAASSGVPVRTLGRWAAAYRQDPTPGTLARRARSDRGRRRIPAEFVEAAEALALRKPPPTVAFIHRWVADIARDRGLPAPSYASIRALVPAINPGLKTLAHQGEAAYRDRFELVYRRSATLPNEQWQADHTLLDVAVLDKSGAPVRPWLTVILDDHSRAVAGYTVLLGAPGAEQTALALHQAVHRKANADWPVMGLPELLCSDHGSDFTSARLERVCLKAHIRVPAHFRTGATV